jgi:hypothetical protein
MLNKNLKTEKYAGLSSGKIMKFQMKYFRIIFKYIFAALFIIYILPYCAISQSKTGTTIGQFLLIEPDARLSAMGNAGVTSYENANAAYYNPGAMGRLENSEVVFSHSIWLAGITYDYFLGTIKMSTDKSLLLSVTSLNSGDMDVRTVEIPNGTGEKYSVSDIAISLGYGQMVSDKFSLGLRVSYIQETIWHSSLSTFGFDLGTIYRISPDGLRIGASISNFGLAARYSGRDLRIRYDLNTNVYGDNGSLPGEVYTDQFYLPVLFRVGVSYPVSIGDNHKFYFAADAFHPSDNNESISIGAEYTFMDIFSVRAGYQNLFLKDTEVGLTLGSGIKYDIANYLLHFDYAWVKYGRLGDTQRFSLGIEF